MIADDLFAGAGGWDLAAAELGIHARGVENMKEARATRDAAGLTTIHDDVWTYEPDGNAAGLIASPPCQTFSQAGKGAGRKALDDVMRGIRGHAWTSLDKLQTLGEEVGDPRTALVLTPLHFAMMHGYRWLAWEQVPTVLPVWEACADRLRTYGWNVWTGLLQAEMYGVPQTRKRAFLLASLDGPVGPPAPTHSRYYARNPTKLDPGVEKWVSMAEALGWGLAQRPSPTVTGGGVETGSAEPIAKLARYTERKDWSDRPVAVVAAGVTGAGTPRNIHHPGPTMTGKGTAYWLSDLSEYIGPVPAIEGETPEDCLWGYDRPSPTIVGSYHPEVVAAPGYRKAGDPPRQKTPRSVRVTVQEAGVLQSFPADHPWQGVSGKQFLQAGNAIPVGLALHALASAAGITAEEVAA